MITYDDFTKTGRLPDTAEKAARIISIEQDAFLEDYPHPLPSLMSIGRRAFLNDYPHPLPSLMFIGRNAFLERYRHHLPLKVAETLNAPIVPDLDAKILDRIAAGGTLKMKRWHTCETIHCMGGWAIHLAGDVGVELERRHGSSFAAYLIFQVSRPDHSVPNFFTTEEEALADMRKYAGR